MTILSFFVRQYRYDWQVYEPENSFVIELLVVTNQFAITMLQSSLNVFANDEGRSNDEVSAITCFKI